MRYPNPNPNPNPNPDPDPNPNPNPNPNHMGPAPIGPPATPALMAPPAPPAPSKGAINPTPNPNPNPNAAPKAAPARTDLAKASVAIHELESLLAESDLAGIDVVDTQLPFVRQVKARLG